MSPELCVDIIDMATVIKEMNASLCMSVKHKQVYPSLDSVTMELRVESKEKGGVS